MYTRNPACSKKRTPHYLTKAQTVSRITKFMHCSVAKNAIYQTLKIGFRRVKPVQHRRFKLFSAKWSTKIGSSRVKPVTDD